MNVTQESNLIWLIPILQDKVFFELDIKTWENNFNFLTEEPERHNQKSFLCVVCLLLLCDVVGQERTQSYKHVQNHKEKNLSLRLGCHYTNMASCLLSWHFPIRHLVQLFSPLILS